MSWKSLCWCDAIIKFQTCFYHNFSLSSFILKFSDFLTVFFLNTVQTHITLCPNRINKRNQPPETEFITKNRLEIQHFGLLRGTTVFRLNQIPFHLFNTSLVNAYSVNLCAERGKRVFFIFRKCEIKLCLIILINVDSILHYHISMFHCH